MSNFGEREVTEGINFYIDLIYGDYSKLNRNNQPAKSNRYETIINQLEPVPNHPNLWVADFTLKKYNAFFTPETPDLVYLAVISEDKRKAALGPRELHYPIFTLANSYAPNVRSHYGIEQVESLTLSREQLRLDTSKGYYYRPYHDSLRISTAQGADFDSSPYCDQTFISVLEKRNGGLQLTVALSIIYGTYYGTRHNELP